MRITRVSTGDERRAMLYASEAARILADRIPGAHTVELAARDEDPPSTVRAYDLLQVWPLDEDGEQLWSDVVPRRGWKPAGALTTDDIDKVQWLLRVAGETDPNIFGPAELAANAWQLFLPQVFDAEQKLALDRVVDHFQELGGYTVELAELVKKKVGRNFPPNDAPVNVLLLLRELGEREAWYALETICA